MRIWTGLPLSACVAVLCVGCSRSKSTAELAADLKSPAEHERIIAVRQLPHHTRDAAEVVPALIGALKDKAADVRHDAALGLGSFGAQAAEAIPALQAAERDRDPRVRKAASIALARIDPQASAKK